MERTMSGSAKALIFAVTLLMVVAFSAAPAAAVCQPSGRACGVNSIANDRNCCPGLLCGWGNVCQSGCRIGITFHRPGEVNPANPCQTCQPNVSRSAWTTLAAGSACGSQSDTQCDNPNRCNASAQCLANNEPNGTPCNDGSLCTPTDSCQGGVCQGAAPVVCTALDTCHVAGTCNPTTGVCSNPKRPDGTACETGNLCTVDRCQAGTCTAGPSNVTCPPPSDVCHDQGTCIPATGQCSDPPKPDHTFCDDGNACTQTDACTGGACVGSDLVDCLPNDQCHARGTCDPATGACSNPAEPDDEFCFDLNSCTVETCQEGVCQSTLVSDGTACTVFNEECRTGTCHSGTCQLDTNVADGTSCDPVFNDLPECKVGTCQAGACTATSNAPNGTDCFDDNGCTGPDFCVNGVCQGGPPTNEDRVCGFLGLCHARTCHAGVCEDDPDPAKADGFGCGSDGEKCTINDRCQGGVCRGTSRPNGAPCDDGEPCSSGDTCQSGTCHAGSSSPNGTACTDGQDVCTTNDRCQAGACRGTNVADGTACSDGQDVCTTGETCQAGVCLGTIASDGTPCDDGVDCNQGDVCLSGACHGEKCHDAFDCGGQPFCSAFESTDGSGCFCTYSFYCGNQSRCGADDSCPSGTACTLSCCPENVCMPACN